MANLIERNNVIAYLRNEVSLGTFMKRTIGKADEACWSICNGIITKVPTVDAVPVVRCRDCKYYEEQDETIGTCLLTESGAHVKGYCAWAERKEE